MGRIHGQRKPNEERTPEMIVHSEVSMVADVYLLGPSDWGGVRGDRNGERGCKPWLTGCWECFIS